jgi:hypothetical protein
MTRIYVIGAGWYGCHIALTLLREGYDVWITDKTDDFFQGSSSKNQNRLHRGYHYPRSAETIRECQQGFDAFLLDYAFCTAAVPQNYYAIARGSRTSTETFCTQFSLKPLQSCPIDLANVDSVFEVDERYINPVTARDFFVHHLGCRQIPFSTFHPTSADITINCTYNHLDPLPFEEYELYMSLLYRISGDPFALTVMDGEFFSIYPYKQDEQLYTVTSVRHGVVWRGRNSVDAPTDLPEIRQVVEAEIATSFPAFRDRATYAGFFTSWKTKPRTECDDRSVRYEQSGNRFRIYGGKITGIFAAGDWISTRLRNTHPNIRTEHECTNRMDRIRRPKSL